MSREAYIVSSVRTPVGKAQKGSLRDVRPEELGAIVVSAALQRVSGLKNEDVDDVLMGCAYPEGPQGMNVGRLIAIKAGLPDTVPGATVNRFCSSGLQTIVMASQAISAGHAGCIVAGGAESMSQVPMSGFYFAPDPSLVDGRTDAYVNMGNTAENVAEKYGISREDQDDFSFRSHQRALDAIRSGRFKDETVPVGVMRKSVVDGERVVEEYLFSEDEGPREDTSLEALARLRPVFRSRGTVTAGNSSQMSDGAAATVVVSDERVKSLGIEPLARIAGFAVAGVSPDIMGVGPIPAVRKVLAQVGLRMEDIGLVELNEAFAAQALAVIRELGLDPDITNVNGGAIALGHPLGCTGAKLTASLLQEMHRRNIRYGICTMCIGGGMGAAAVLENLRN